MFSGEVDPPLRLDYVPVEKGLLAWVEEGESASRELVIMPHLGRADLELALHLGVDAR